MSNNKQLLLGFLFAMPFGALAQYSGKVYVDANGNNQYDKGETLLQDVAVSDGLHVVKTDRKGAFRLPGHDRQRFVFITTPSGYKTYNQYYQPVEKGVDKEYNFGVIPHKGAVARDGSHKFVHISDTEIRSAAEHDDWVDDLRRYAANEDAAFIIHTGDICYEGGLQSHIQIANTKNMNCPMFYTIGNHDLVKGKYGEELFESLYGPVFYSFDMGNVHYIVTPMLGGDYRPSYTKKDVYRWLKNDLAQVKPGTPIMAFNHDLLTQGDDFIYGISDDEQINLNDHNLKAWLYGHWHINYIKKQGQAYSVGTSTPIRGGIDHSASAFRVMHVDDQGDFRSELRYSYIDKSMCINSIAVSQSPLDKTGVNLPISVNVYHTISPTAEVTYEIMSDTGEKIASGNLKQNSDWNWGASPAIKRVRPGQMLTITSRAKFNNGETAEAESSFLYMPARQPKVKLTGNWDNLLGCAEHIGVAVDTLQSPLQLSWVENVEGNCFMASPIVHQGKVYTATVDENHEGKGAIHALCAYSGQLAWSYPVRNSIQNSIAASDGVILAQDGEGYLYAVDAENGKLLWEKKLNVRGLPELIEGIVVNDGIVYAGTGKGLGAVNVRDGKTLWENGSWGQGEGTTSTITYGDGTIVMGVQWSALHGNDARTGKRLWSRSDAGLRMRASSPSYHDGLLYVISSKSLFVLDANTGKTIIQKDLPYSLDVTSTPLVTDSEIIFGTAKNGIVAVHRHSLEEKWTLQTGNAMIYTAPYVRGDAAMVETSPVLSGDCVYFGASDGILYGVDRESGLIVWKHPVGAPIYATPAISGNALYVTDYAGNVYGFVSSNQAE